MSVYRQRPVPCITLADGRFRCVAAHGFFPSAPWWTLGLFQLSGARRPAGLCTPPWVFQREPPVLRVTHTSNEMPALPLTSWGPSRSLRQAHFLPMSNGQLENYMDVAYLRHPAQSECGINHFPFRSLESNGVAWE